MREIKTKDVAISESGTSSILYIPVWHFVYLFYLKLYLLSDDVLGMLVVE